MRFLGIAFLFFISLTAHAHNARLARVLAEPANVCESYLDDTQMENLETLLAKLPQLRVLMREMANDPKVSIYVKRLLERALLEPKTEVIRLTKELRKSWNVGPRYGGLATTQLNIPGWGYPKAALSGTAIFNAAIRTNFTRDFGVAVPDGRSPNALMTLIHELAHVRFSIYYSQHYDEICQRMPSSFTLYKDGKCILSKQLLELLNEKFAFETQYRVLGKSGRYFPGLTHEKAFRRAREKRQDLTASIGYEVADFYKITIPQVLYLADVSISEILLAGTAVQEVDDAVKLYSDPAAKMPTTEELPAALAMLDFLRPARGLPTSYAGHLTSVSNTLNDLVLADDGFHRATEFLKKVIAYAEKYPATRETLVGIFNAPVFRLDLLVVNWPLPEGRPFVWEDLEGVE